jgi:hypothetical protein
MSHLYFDESIHDRGSFIIGAAIFSSFDLSPVIRNLWVSLGLDPSEFEYKSSSPKAGNPAAQQHRSALHALLKNAKIGLVVCPSDDRQSLGFYAIELAKQLLRSRSIDPPPLVLYLDDNIHVASRHLAAARDEGISVLLGQDSRVVGGLQLADHVAHSLSGMLLEQMGLLRKHIKAGENSGYDPELLIELGFELWASLRYSLIYGPNEATPDDDQLVTATFPMEAFGLHVAPSCHPELANHARARFGTNYLGCIH